MRYTMGILTALGILLVATVAAADREHMSRGVIVAAAPARVTLLAHGRRLTLMLADTTLVLDDDERPLGPAGLRLGDYVREECLELSDGRYLAQRITVLRPAWRELESPEK